jgi:hypothetical protein
MATAEHPDKWRRPYRAPPRRYSQSAPEQAVEEGPAAALRGGIAGFRTPGCRTPGCRPSDAGPGMQGPGCRAQCRIRPTRRCLAHRDQAVPRAGWSKAQPLSGPATPLAGDFHRIPPGRHALSRWRCRFGAHDAPGIAARALPGAKEPWRRGYRDVFKGCRAARSDRGPAAGNPVAGPACHGIGHRRDGTADGAARRSSAMAIRRRRGYRRPARPSWLGDRHPPR